MFKKISCILIPILYIAAGINHFRSPESYYKIIPEYLPWPVFINLFSGAAEIILGLLFVLPKTRSIAAYGIIALLIAFIPAHIVMIQKGFCLSNGYCLPQWAIWVRLFPLQFLLMLWAWVCRK
ncbi:DoxX family protein [Ferruginibacter profundus]